LPSNSYRFYDSQFPNPLKNVISDGGGNTEPFYEGTPQDVPETGKSWYVFCATPEEILEIRSSLEVGAPIAYPDTYSPIIEIIEQSFQFPNAIADGSCMDICELMIDCINNDSDVREALFNALQFGVPASSGDGVNDTIADGNVLAGVTCDNDQLFGAVTGLVDLLNSIATDILLKLSAESNKIGQIGDLIEAIPGINNLPADDVLQMIESFFDHLTEDYDAYYDTALRDTYRCDLFCIAKDTCTITPRDFFEYFVGELGDSITTLTILDFLEAILLADYSGVQIVHAMNVLVTGLWMFGASITNISADTMTRMVNALFNDPDSDWSTVCDECPTNWGFTSDFHDDENIWNVTQLFGNDMAQWVDTEGYLSVDAENASGVYSRIIRIETDVFTPTTIDDISFNFNMTKGISISTATCLAIVATKNDDTTVSTTQSFTGTSNGDNQTYNLDVNETDIKKLLVFLRCWTGEDTSYAGSVELNSVTVHGQDTNPFEV